MMTTCCIGVAALPRASEPSPPNGSDAGPWRGPAHAAIARASPKDNTAAYFIARVILDRRWLRAGQGLAFQTSIRRAMADPMDPKFTAQNPIVAAAERIRAR